MLMHHSLFGKRLKSTIQRSSARAKKPLSSKKPTSAAMERRAESGRQGDRLCVTPGPHVTSASFSRGKLVREASLTL
jgi:hypothetical protein